MRDTELLVASAARRLAVPPPPGRRTITLMRDHRPYLNAIRAIVAQMRDAGLPVISSERELSGEVEVLLRLPTRKRRGRPGRGSRPRWNADSQPRARQ